MLLFTLCMLLTLFVDLVGGMGTCEADPSQTWRYSQTLYLIFLYKYCVFCLVILQVWITKHFLFEKDDL